MKNRIRPCLCALDDAVLRRRLQEIINENGINTVVETGIDWGGSTRFFSKMVPFVYGVDNDIKRVDAFWIEIDEDKLESIDLILGNSPDVIKDLIEAGLNAVKTLFFLDAHWQSYWPLKDEIRAIPRGEGILVMHDARVPNCPSLGVDSYDGQELSYEYLKDVLTEWSSTHRVEYNDDTAEGSRRGVMFVFPK